MPLVTATEVQRELDVFPGIRQDACYADFVAVAQFLTDRAEVVRALGHLERCIAQKADAAWTESEDFKGRAALWDDPIVARDLLASVKEAKLLLHLAGEKKVPYFKRLLSTCLTDMEVSQGFTLSGTLWSSKAQYYLGPVEADAFRAQISAGRPAAKDPFVDPGHGEYTHRLQWYAVMAAATGRLRLANPVAAVYKAVGAYAAPEGGYVGFKWGLWDALCDRDNGTAGLIPFKAVAPTDFRCPNCLNTFLREHGRDHGLPLVGAFARGRYAKRTSGTVDPLDYIAQKVYKTAYGSLTTKQRDTIQRLVFGENRGVFDPNEGWRYP